MPIPLTTPLTSKSKRVAIGAGNSERNGTYFGRLTSLGEAICRGPTIAGDESGGTGVAAAAGAGLPAAAGEAPGVADPGPPEPSAHALCSQAIMTVRSNIEATLLTAHRPPRFPMFNLISLVQCACWMIGHEKPYDTGVRAVQSSSMPL